MLCLLGFIFFGVLLWFFLKLDSDPLLALYEKYAPNKHKLRNKTVWIVGSSTGIGEQLALKLASLNCRLVLTSTTESKLEQVKANCLKASTSLKPDDILVLAYDVTNYEENDVAFKKIIDKFGNVDVVVNNQARIFTSKVIEDDFELVRKLMAVNYFSPVYITKLVLKHWLAVKFKGQLLVTSSVGAQFDFPFFSHYSASKRAVNAFFRDVANQHECDGIKVSIVCPGPLATDLESKSFEVVNEQGKKRKTNFGGGAAMTSERCAELMVITLANKLNETWISIQPMLLLTYLSAHFNYPIHVLFRLFNVAKIAERRLLNHNSN